MKEFKKWQKQFLQEKFINERKMPLGIVRDAANATAGLTWRAALEMILIQMNEDKFKDNGELRTFIEQELEIT